MQADRATPDTRLLLALTFRTPRVHRDPELHRSFGGVRARWDSPTVTVMAEQFVVLTGTVLIQGKSPDGDSIRFLPQHPDTLKELTNGARVRPSPDGSVQLRLDAIDAPETHYAGQHQPLGTQARDELVSFAGFRDVTYNKSGTVTAATPNTIPAVIAAKLVELHGRPVCYLFINPTRGWDEGQTLPLSDEILNDSVNAHMVSTGRAYTTLYTSTPLAQREYFTRLATTARGAAGSVWTADSSARFTLTDHASIGEGGQLLLPKLFRRCTDYLTAKSKGSATSFLGWLTQASDTGASEDDDLLLAGQKHKLSDLITEDGTTIEFHADLLDLVFVEK